jgi:HEAT repeat protein
MTGADKIPGGNILVQEVVDFLIQCLEHEYFDIRGAAALSLGRAGSQAKSRAVMPLQKQTEDKNQTAAESAILALGMLESIESVPLLTKILQKADFLYGHRTYSAVALGLTRDKSSCKLMTDIVMKPKENEQVKAACLLGMAMSQNEPSAFTLLKVMNNPNMKGDLRAMAATALGKMGLPKVQMGKKKLNIVETLARLLSGQKIKRKLKLSAIMAITALGPSGRISPDGLIELLSRIYTSERNAEIRSFILMGIGELAKEGSMKEKGRILLRKALAEEKNPSLLASACLAAGLSKDRECIPTLRKIFKDQTNPDIKGHAAIGLGLLNDLESTKMIVEAITDKGAPGLRANCCLALGLMGANQNKEALPLLRDILNNGKNPKVRGAAGMALMLLNDKNALEILLKAVKEGDSYLRQSIIVVIGYSRDLRAAKPLMELFNSDEAKMTNEIRAIIVTALGYIIEEADEPVLKRLSKHYNQLLSKYDAIIQIMGLL